MKKIVITQKEMLNLKHGSLTYNMAMILLNEGAPIRFNKLNINLKPENIEIYGEFRDRVKQDGSHEFIFEEILNKLGE